MTANGLAVARSLGRKGIPVVGVGACAAEPGLRCRYLRARHTAPDVQDEEKLLDFLVSLGGRLAGRGVLFVTADEYVLFCSRYRDELSGYYAFNLPSRQTVECFLDKEKTSRFASRNQIRHPKTMAVTIGRDVETSAAGMAFPCILKPRDSHLWRRDYKEQKVIVVHSAEELHRTCRGLGPHASKVILQEIIPGPDDSIYQYLAYGNRESEIIAEFTCRKLRQYPPHFGIACLCESRQEPGVREEGRRLLSRIDARGIFAIEYKMDARDGRPVFLEANLRTSFFGELPVSSGVDFPYLMYSDLVDANPGRGPAEFQEGIRLWNLALDLGCYYRLRKARETTLAGWAGKLLGGRIAHTYLAWDDLRPWMFVYGRLLLRTLSRVLRRITGTRGAGTKEGRHP